jgi:hypothetical protein
MPEPTKRSVASTIARFFAQAAQLDAPAASSPPRTTPHVRFTDPVLKVLFQRLKTHVLGRLAAESSADRVRAASSASEQLAACGMAEFVPHVAAVVETLERVRRVDWEAHGGWYWEVVREGL